MSSSHDDMTDAAALVWNAMKQLGLPAGQAASSSSAAAINYRAASKSAMVNAYSKALDKAVSDSMRKASVFNTPKLTPGGAGDNRIGHMRGALKATSSKHLPSYNQMSYGRKLSFISRVERHGKKQYPNQQHMRDIYAHYIAARVAHELKE